MCVLHRPWNPGKIKWLTFEVNAMARSLVEVVLDMSLDFAVVTVVAEADKCRVGLGVSDTAPYKGRCSSGHRVYSQQEGKNLRKLLCDSDFVTQPGNDPMGISVCQPVQWFSNWGLGIPAGLCKGLFQCNNPVELATHLFLVINFLFIVLWGLGGQSVTQYIHNKALVQYM